MYNLPYKRRFIITQTFLNPNSFYASGFHLGVDFVGLDEKKVYAIHDGTVLTAEYQNAFGNTVVIQQPDNLFTRYSHLATIEVKKDQNVLGGQTIIGVEGQSGSVYGGNDPRHLDLRIAKLPTHTNDTSQYANPCDSLGIPNVLNSIVTPGGGTMTKLKNIVIYYSEVDRRAALYLADAFTCAAIEFNLLSADILDQAFENIYVIGTSQKPVAKAVNIYGQDRYQTCQKVLDFIGTKRS